MASALRRRCRQRQGRPLGRPFPWLRIFSPRPSSAAPWRAPTTRTRRPWSRGL